MEKRRVKILLHEGKEFEEMIAEFKKESDRATVILGAAKIDAQLYLLLSKYLKATTSNQDELLDGDNPLGTFSAKINLAYRLGLIDAHFAKSIHLVRKIRNSFAHEFKSMSLATGSHADRIRELVVHFKDYIEYLEYKESEFGKEGGLENDFKMILVLMIIRLDTAAHYAQPIKENGCALVPPNWKRILKAKDQRQKPTLKKKTTVKKAQAVPSAKS